jgi:tetratricopeptide (TPR) repeat protein
VSKTRQRNEKLAAAITEAGWSHAQMALAFGRVAAERQAEDQAGVGRSHVSHWVAGSRPSGSAPGILIEALSRRLGRTVTADEIGLTPAATSPILDWNADTLTTLVDLGRSTLDVERRSVLRAAGYSVAALTLPDQLWWDRLRDRPAEKHKLSGGRGVGPGDLDAVRETVQLFTRIDQRRGGGHARAAVVQYLTSDVAGYLRASYVNDQVRRGMFSTAGELAYLIGWMAFDNSEHAAAQQYFAVAVKLAAEADDAPLAAHILRAMAHQAVDLGHHRQAVRIAEASLDGRRYKDASPRERSLIGVVHARALAVDGQHAAASRALLRAETDLASATAGDDEPGRVFFFGEASLAHETACTLRDMGDPVSATKEFQRSVRTRKAATFTRTHAVTLGYLGAVQARSGSIEEACGTWSEALDVMDGIHSGRARQAVRDMRSGLSVYRAKGIRSVTELDARAARYLAAVDR